ncbi:LysR family transcriptional regulator [Marinobacteraceae bacterium S3BR75-40.1]
MNLPPLKTLPVFEAVARLNSFSRAAEELNVSQSAVSHQIKLLEAHLGEPLFHRGGRHLSLSEQGQVFYEGISSALLQIERTTDQLLGRSDTRLRLAVFSSFAVRWLIPRLPTLQRECPAIDLALEMTSESPTLSDRVADCFITIHQDNPAFQYDLLYSERLFPICSRAYWQEIQGGTSEAITSLSPEAIAGYPLLSTYSIFGEESGDWRKWFAVADQPLPRTAKLQHFSHMLLALEAARHHQGIALTNDYMLNTLEDAGDFVRLPCHTLITGDRFYFAHKIGRRNEPALRSLRQWLVKEAIHSGLRDPR